MKLYLLLEHYWEGCPSGYETYSQGTNVIGVFEFKHLAEEQMGEDVDEPDCSYSYEIVERTLNLTAEQEDEEDDLDEDLRFVYSTD